MRLETPHHMHKQGLPEHLQGKKRGQIKGWSKGSRKRMRDAILDSGVPDGYRVLTVTLTVPGDRPLTEAEAKSAWWLFAKELRSMDACGFWRLEIQKRGMVHWHLLLCVASSISAVQIDKAWLRVLGQFETPVSVTYAQYEYLKDRMPDGWEDPKWEFALDLADGSEDYTTDYNKRDELLSFTLLLPLKRSLVVGAHHSACKVEQSDGHVGWLRYMMDHCTKAKQEQVLTWKATRHWGYINKRKLPPAEGSRKELTYEESITVLRLVSKWGRPRIRAACDFGCKLGFRSGRGRRGASVWFGSPEFFARVVSFAKANPAQTRVTLLPAA